jgi:hypothetical protein
MSARHLLGEGQLHRLVDSEYRYLCRGRWSAFRILGVVRVSSSFVPHLKGGPVDDAF